MNNMLNEKVKAPKGDDLYELAMNVYADGCRQYGSHMRDFSEIQSKIYCVPVIESIIAKLCYVYDFEGAKDVPYEDKEIDKAINRSLELSTIYTFIDKFKDCIKGVVTNDTVAPIYIVLKTAVIYLIIGAKLKEG